jgi:tetratricopeptide (TPR) repeat protein
MKNPWLWHAIPLLVLAYVGSTSWAQRTQSPPGMTIPMGPPAQPPNAAKGMIFLSGRVFLEDGTALTEPAAIQTICRNHKRIEGYSDSGGGFSVQFSTSSHVGVGVSDVSATGAEAESVFDNQHEWRDCELRVVLPGFSSNSIQLNRVMSSFESTDVGKIVLHRLNQAEGSTISATSAAAPEAARKDLEKGRDWERRGEWDNAQKLFEKAIEIYPKFAVAWFELGRVQFHKNDDAGARHSFAQALAADPRYVSPYEGLAQMAAQARHWEELFDASGKWLALNPVSFPDAWFFHGVADYYLQNIAAAERSARQGIKIDEARQVPKLEYLLGLVLMQRREYPEAAEHMRQYMQLTAKPAEVEEAKKQLSEIARLSSLASVSSESGRK